MDAAELYKHLQELQLQVNLARWNVRFVPIAMSAWPEGCPGKLDEAVNSLSLAADILLVEMQCSLAKQQAINEQSPAQEAPAAHQEAPQAITQDGPQEPQTDASETPPAPEAPPVQEEPSSSTSKRGRGRPKRSHEGDRPAMRVLSEKLGPNIEEAFGTETQSDVPCPVCESDPTQASISNDATVKAELEQFQVRSVEAIAEEAPATPVPAPQAEAPSMDRHFQRIEKYFGDTEPEGAVPDSLPVPSVPPSNALQDDFLDDLTF